MFTAWAVVVNGKMQRIERWHSVAKRAADAWRKTNVNPPYRVRLVKLTGR
jgi:hypothetical protein